jgi:hypothetical protein
MTGDVEGLLSSVEEDSSQRLAPGLKQDAVGVRRQSGLVASVVLVRELLVLVCGGKRDVALVVVEKHLEGDKGKCVRKADSGTSRHRRHSCSPSAAAFACGADRRS